MALAATTPTVVSATYDQWAFTFRTEGLPLAQPGGATAGTVNAHATLVKYRTREDGVDEMSPLPSDTIQISVADLYSLAATDGTVAAAMSALITAVGHIAQQQGKL